MKQPASILIVTLMLIGAGHVCRAQQEPAHRGTHLYQPPGVRVNDPWLVNVDGTVHLFHLPDAWHATSRDCVFWEPHRAILANSAFTAAERNYNTEPEVWTGCAVHHEGKIYLFWTGNMGVNRRLCNRTCLSISSDGGKTFTHHADNPVIKPDPRWYDTENDPAPEYPYHGKTHNWSGGVDGKMALMDWRDIAIVKDTKTGLFHGYIVARLRGRKNDKESACIARVSSKDLVHWEVHPPAFNPGTWGLHEVPDVFQLGGKWYLTAMATNPREGVYHGDDPLLRWGHVVGESDTPEGPFRLVKDNCVMAGVDQARGYYSMRAVEFKGERLAFACGDKLSLAVKLVPREGGGLQDVWWPDNEKLFGEKRGLALRDAPGKPTIEAPPRDEDSFMILADIELGTASAAGITFRKADGGQPHTLFLDSTKGCFEWVGGDIPGKGRIAARTWPIKPGGKHTIRVIHIEQHVVVYLDDRYVMNGRGLKFETAGLALTSVGGKARLRDIQYWGPRNGMPNPLPVGVGASPKPAVFNTAAVAAFADDPRLGNMKANKILFLGNSITRCKPGGAWQLDCGCAATAPEKDYAHLVARYIADANGGRAPAMKADNVYYHDQYEQHYAGYNAEVSMKEFLDWQPDIVVMAIGENIENLDTVAKETAFATSFRDLLSAFKKKSNPAIFVRSRFMGPNPVQDRIMKQCCEEVGGVFVSMDSAGLSGDPLNYGALSHPSDRGMKAIADALFEAMRAQAVVIADAAAKTFSVTDFGAKPNDGKDDIAAIRAAVAAAARQPGSTLLFPCGQYDIRDAAGVAAWERMITAAVPGKESWRGNAPQGLEGSPQEKNTVFRLKAARRLTIDGQGSTLMIHGLNQTLLIQDCRDIVVRNLKIDHEPPTAMTGKVLAVAGRRIDVEILDARPVGGEPFIALQAYDPVKRLPTGQETFAGVQSTELLREGVLRLNMTGDERGNFRPPVGHLLAMRHVLCGYEPIEVKHSSGVLLEGVDIHAGAGMGIVGVGTENLTLSRVRVLPRPGTLRLVSTTADATHFINCSGTVTLEGCHFEGMGDDHLNVHGQYEFVHQRLDARTIEARIGTLSGFGQWSDYWVWGWAAAPKVGDPLGFFRLPSLDVTAQARVEGIQYDGKTGRSRITFTEPLPDTVKEGDQFQDVRQIPALRVRNCYFGPNRARGTLITTRDAVVEGCTFDRTGGSPVFICCEVGWLEAPAPAKVVIRNNRFLDCGYAVANEGAAITAVFNQGSAVSGWMRDLTIEGNFIKGYPGAGVLAAQVDGLVFRNNRFEATRPAMVLRGCRNVHSEGNRQDGGKPVIQADSACEASTLDLPDAR